MNNKKVHDKIELLDVVALAKNLPEHRLWRGEIGAVVECYPDDAFEVEFVSQDGYTDALVTLHADDLIPLRQNRVHSDVTSQPMPL